MASQQHLTGLCVRFETSDGAITMTGPSISFFFRKLDREWIRTNTVVMRNTSAATLSIVRAWCNIHKGDRAMIDFVEGDSAANDQLNAANLFVVNQSDETLLNLPLDQLCEVWSAADFLGVAGLSDSCAKLVANRREELRSTFGLSSLEPDSEDVCTDQENVLQKKEANA